MSILLDDCHYDCIILGTGLTLTILAAALAKQGKKILHIDQHAYYGSQDTTLNYTEFTQFIQQHTNTQRDATQTPAQPTEEQVSSWQRIITEHNQHSTLQSSETSSNNTRFIRVAPQSAFCGASISTTQQPQPEDSESVSPPVDPLVSLSRSFCVDLTPRLLFSVSSLVDVIAHSHVSSYLDFKALNTEYLCLSDRGVYKVPVSRSDVFQSNLIEMKDKRKLMKFLTSIHNQDTDEKHPHAEGNAIAIPLPGTPDAEQSFVDWLISLSLPSNLRNIILYSIALCDYKQQEEKERLTAADGESIKHQGQQTTSQGLSRLRSHMSSLGRFGSGGFLFPVYGMGELPQSFARLCAVHTGVYILKFRPKAIVLSVTEKKEEQKGKELFLGIITAYDQLITADVFISEPDYVHEEFVADNNTDATVSCAVCVINGALLTGDCTPMDQLSFSVFPPDSVNNKHPVKLMLVGDAVNAAPAGHSLLYLFTPASTPDNSAERELQPVIDYLVNNSKQENNQLTVLTKAFYQHRQRTPAQSDVDHLYVCSDASPLQWLDQSVAEASRLFHLICPSSDLATTIKSTQEQQQAEELHEELEELNILDPVLNQSPAGSLSEAEEKKQQDASSEEAVMQMLDDLSFG